MCEHDVEYKAYMLKKLKLWRYADNLSDNPFNVRSSKIKEGINRNMYFKSSSKDINNQVATQGI